MKFVTARPFADPDAAAGKLSEIANATEAVQDGRIYIKLINDAFLKAGGTLAQPALLFVTAGLRLPLSCAPGLR